MRCTIALNILFYDLLSTLECTPHVNKKGMVMKILVLGASGATGKLVVSNALERDVSVKIVIREHAKIPDSVLKHKNIEIFRGNIDTLGKGTVHSLVQDCNAIVCCLGHNITFKGLFGKPRTLVVDTVKKIATALQSYNTVKKFIVMSTTAYTNKNGGETNSIIEMIVLKLLELVLPPHKDNMLTGDYLVYTIGRSEKMEWVAVRPDSLINNEKTTEYELYEKKTRSPIFNAGKTSRINVSQYMVELVLNDTLWNVWKFKTPVIYNKE